MSPVQTFSSSPISAAKAPSATGQAQQQTSAREAPPAVSAATTTGSAASASRYGPPAAQPASRPPAPTATGGAAVLAAGVDGGRPNPTPITSSSPPAPQPGALPTPAGAPMTAAAATATAASSLPPPPKKGESLGPQHQMRAAGAATATTTTTTTTTTTAQEYPPMPAQMSWSAPNVARSMRGTSITATGEGSQYVSPYAAAASKSSSGPPAPSRLADLSHPPGYQQNVHAAEFSSQQRVAHESYVASNSSFSSNFGGGGGGGEGAGESIWNTAKKWASAAGDSLAAAEKEVWKAVNKDQK